MSRASFTIEIENGNKKDFVERATGFLKEKGYERAKPESGGTILFNKTPGWPVVSKCIELSIVITDDGRTFIKCDGYIPTAIFHKAFKIGELPFTDKPTLTINIVRREGYEDLMALKEHLMNDILTGDIE